jgi:hypothetical protein
MITQHIAREVFQERELHFQILVLDRQLFIWIGTEPPRLSNLSLAIPTHMVTVGPRCCAVLPQRWLADLGARPAGPRSLSHLTAAWSR